VVDAEVTRKPCAYFGQNFFAFLHVHIGDTNMARERMLASAERPNMDIVHFLDAGNLQNSSRYFGKAHLPRAAFEQDVGGFPQDSYRGPEDETRYNKPQRRVEPLRAGPTNDQSSDENGDIGECITKVM